MPTFTFTATSQDGKAVSGVRSASSRSDLISALHAESLVVTSVSEYLAAGQRPAAGLRSFSGSMSAFLQGRIRQGHLLAPMKQLAAMLRAGLSLTDSLQTVAHGTDSARLQTIILDVRRGVQQGLTFTEALRQHPMAFDQLFVSMIHAGETSGALAQNVARLAAYLDRQESFRRKIKAAMLYPKVIFGVFVLLTCVVFLFVIPRFGEIFSDMDAKLPPLTEYCLGFSQFLRHNIFLIAPAVFVLYLCVNALRRTEGGRQMYDRVVLQLPFFGKLTMEAAVERLSMTLGTLLASGIPLTDAMQIASATLNNSVLEEEIIEARRQVMGGRGLAESLAGAPHLPRLLPRMVRAGEESGSLSEMLSDVASHYHEEVDYALTRIGTIIEPVLICCMGVVVLITIIAVYLPIFNLSRAVGGG